MAGVNMESILAKAQAYTESPEFKKKVSAKTDDIMLHGGGTPTGTLGAAISIAGASAAADKFIEVLQGEISSLGASIDAELTHSSPYKVGDNRYQITVDFSGGVHRESLYPEGYPGGINNIVALLNKGYSAGKKVYGVWHGQQIASLQHRDGLGFISSAVSNFMGNYGNEYGVLDITVDPIYG